jgi:hypothetical protein
MKRCFLFLLFLVVGSLHAATPWTWTVTVKNPCYPTNRLESCKYEFRYTVDGAWSSQYTLTQPGKPSGQIFGQGEAVATSTRNGEGIWVRAYGQTNYGGQLLYTDIGYISSNAPNCLITYILECPQPLTIKHAKVCVKNVDSISHRFQLYQQGAPFVACGSDTYIEVGPGQTRCLEVSSDDITGMTMERMGWGASTGKWLPNQACPGGSGIFLSGEDRETVNVPFIWEDQPPTVGSVGTYRAAVAAPYDPGSGDSNAPSPIVWSSNTNSDVARDESVRRAAESAYDLGTKNALQAHADAVALVDSVRTNADRIAQGLAAGAESMSNSLHNAAGNITNRLWSMQQAESNHAAAISSTVSNAASAAAEKISSNLLAGFYSSSTGLLAGLYGISSNLAGLKSGLTNAESETNVVASYDLRGLGTNYASATLERDNSTAFTFARDDVSSLQGYLGVPSDAGGYSAGAWEADIMGFTLKVDPTTGMMGTAFRLCKKVATWFLYMAYATMMFKDAFSFVTLGGTARGTSVPNFQMELFGTGGNVVGGGMTAGLVMVFMIGYGTLLAVFPTVARALFTGGFDMTINPFSDSGGVEMGRAVYWLSCAVPITKMMELAVSYLVWRLTMIKAGTVFIGLIRTTPA